MPKAKFKNNLGASEPGELAGFEPYDGPVPPAGVYTAKVKRFSVKLNKNGDEMASILTELQSKDPKKAKYNGCGIWNNINFTEQGAPYLNSFLKAIGSSWKDFWNVSMDEGGEYPKLYTRIGRVMVGEGIDIRLSTRMGTDNRDGSARAEVGQFLSARDDTPTDAEDAEADEFEDDDDATDDSDEVDADPPF